MNDNLIHIEIGHRVGKKGTIFGEIVLEDTGEELVVSKLVILGIDLSGIQDLNMVEAIVRLHLVENTIRLMAELTGVGEVYINQPLTWEQMKEAIVRVVKNGKGETE